MKIICSTVVRAAKQGDIHGGLYVIDIDSGEVIHHAPYERDFVNDNERGGERVFAAFVFFLIAYLWLILLALQN